jgi:hypothetical protein
MCSLPCIYEKISISERNVNLIVIRDDLLDDGGGTKLRGLIPYLSHPSNQQFKEFVYASPVVGAAQLAIASACKTLGKTAVVFTATRKIRHINTVKVEELGGDIHYAKLGACRISNIKAQANEYASSRMSCKMLPWGLAGDGLFMECLVSGIRAGCAAEKPDAFGGTIWVVAGSGTLLAALCQVFVNARFKVVKVGANTQFDPHVASRIEKVFIAPEKYEQEARTPPPYPSNAWYDAKMWQFVMDNANDGDIVWNVA